MERAEPFRDIEREMERFMVNLYKRTIRRGGLNPKYLKGDWAEARTLLKAHFGKVTRMADQNQHRLVTLYRIAVDEVKASQN
ncbi:MAG TPA: hypothetical protein VES58_00185 [Syntrophobacteria bacterium]|nr:hypothetical protein [Syntrophobacteria bacterium]